MYGVTLIEILVVVALVALLSCMALGAKPDPNDPVRIEDYQGTIRMACVGDSITAGVGAARGQSYPAQLGKMLGERWEVRNFGVSGSTLLNHGNSRFSQARSAGTACIRALHPT